MLTVDKGILLTNMAEVFPSSNTYVMVKEKVNKNESYHRCEWEQWLSDGMIGFTLMDWIMLYCTSQSCTNSDIRLLRVVKHWGWHLWPVEVNGKTLINSSCLWFHSQWLTCKTMANWFSTSPPALGKISAPCKAICLLIFMLLLWQYEF